MKRRNAVEGSGLQKLRRAFEPLILQHKCGHQADAKEADDLDEHVSGGVDGREALPISIGNIRRDGHEHSRDHKEPDALSEAR
jgi:hypothetical protein